VDFVAACQNFQDPIVSPILGLEKVQQPVNSSDPFCKSHFGLADRHSKREIMRDKFTWEEKVEQPVNSSDPFFQSYFGLVDRHSKREIMGDKGRQNLPQV